MQQKTYYAAKDLKIQSHPIPEGTAVGTGDVGAGHFAPAKGLEKAVGLGHVLPRLADGRITDTRPSKPGKPPSVPGQESTSQ